MIILYSGVVPAKYILFCYKGYGTGVDKDRLERMALQNSINSIKKLTFQGGCLQAQNLHDIFVTSSAKNKNKIN